MDRWRRQLALFVVMALMAAAGLIRPSHSTSVGRFVLLATFLLALLFFSTLAGLWSRDSRTRFVVGQLVALAAAGVVTAVGATVWVRGRPPENAPVTPSAGPGAAPDPALGGCLTLQKWWWTEDAAGTAEVRAEVLPGRAGTVGLDAQVTRANEDIWTPVVVHERTLRTAVQPGKSVVLSERLRRLVSGSPDRLALRFSCKPEGPTGIFGVIDYVQGAADAFEGTRDLVRPLPPAATATLHLERRP